MPLYQIPWTLLGLQDISALAKKPFAEIVAGGTFLQLRMKIRADDISKIDNMPVWPAVRCCIIGRFTGLRKAIGELAG